MKKGFGSRLMHPGFYKDANEYRPLATLKTEDGKFIGDLIATVKPKGDLGKGTIIYVAADMLNYGKRNELLGAILKLTKNSVVTD